MLQKGSYCYHCSRHVSRLGFSASAERECVHKSGCRGSYPAFQGFSITYISSLVHRLRSAARQASARVSLMHTVPAFTSSLEGTLLSMLSLMLHAPYVFSALRHLVCVTSSCCMCWLQAWCSRAAASHTWRVSMAATTSQIHLLGCWSASCMATAIMTMSRHNPPLLSYHPYMPLMISCTTHVSFYHPSMQCVVKRTAPSWSYHPSMHLSVTIYTPWKHHCSDQRHGSACPNIESGDCAGTLSSFSYMLLLPQGCACPVAAVGLPPQKVACSKISGRQTTCKHSARSQKLPLPASLCRQGASAAA